MKVCLVQPRYSFDYSDIDSCFEGMLDLIDQCDESMDVIVLPEYCDIPAATPNGTEFQRSVRTYNARILEKVIETAKRCHAIVFANFAHETENGWRNTTHCIDREGNVVGLYYKAHPAPFEDIPVNMSGSGMDSSYSRKDVQPYTIELEGVRYAFLTCYDFYMYESFASIARQNVDVIVGCSHQRTDSHDALEIIGRFLCYNTNAYLIRSSVSLGEDSEIGGCSMAVSPKGEMLLNMKSRVGLETVEIDPHAKYYKAAGFRGKTQKPKAHYEYIDDGRRPWLYRPGGSMMLPTDKRLPYPRVCAHRGFNTVAPENSLPAFGSAVALGAEEIEFDLWVTKDGELVSMHDDRLDRLCNGTGKVNEYTLEELRAFDFGCKTGEHFKGLQVITFEDILKKFACTTIMNIHVKIWDRPEVDPQFERIASLIRKYDAQKHVYMMSSTTESLKAFKQIAPDIACCQGAGPHTSVQMVDAAIENGFEKIQLVYNRPFDKALIDKAHAHGIRCNYFFADTPEETLRMLEMGIDTILTNDYLNISNTVKDYLSKR